MGPTVSRRIATRSQTAISGLLQRLSEGSLTETAARRTEHESNKGSRKRTIVDASAEMHEERSLIETLELIEDIQRTIRRDLEGHPGSLVQYTAREVLQTVKNIDHLAKTHNAPELAIDLHLDWGDQFARGRPRYDSRWIPKEGADPTYAVHVFHIIDEALLDIAVRLWSSKDGRHSFQHSINRIEAILLKVGGPEQIVREVQTPKKGIRRYGPGYCREKGMPYSRTRLFMLDATVLSNAGIARDLLSLRLPAEVTDMIIENFVGTDLSGIDIATRYGTKWKEYSPHEGPPLCNLCCDSRDLIGKDVEFFNRSWTCPCRTKAVWSIHARRFMYFHENIMCKEFNCTGQHGNGDWKLEIGGIPSRYLEAVLYEQGGENDVVDINEMSKKHMRGWIYSIRPDKEKEDSKSYVHD